MATDISPGQVERGRARSEEEGYDIEWQVADAEDLPFDDERFDCAGSVFGMMIAPRPEVAARELFRVVRPGNTVGITAWTPDSFAVEMFKIGRSYSPLPAGIPTSDEWGREDTVRERFDGLAGTLEMERHTLGLGGALTRRVRVRPGERRTPAGGRSRCPGAGAARGHALRLPGPGTPLDGR